MVIANSSWQGQAVAYHEVGHAIMCIEFGIKFDYITINKVDWMDGHLEHCLQDQTNHLIEDRKEIAISLGGMLAEEGIVSYENMVEGFRNDLLDICKIFLTKYSRREEFETVLNEVMMFTKQVIESRRNEINTLAIALQKIGTLTYSEVLAIYEQEKMEVTQNGDGCVY